MRLRLGNRYRGAFVMLHPLQGRMGLAVIGPLLGVLVHIPERRRFHNTIRHLLVLIAAALHLQAIAAVLGLADTAALAA